MMMSNGSATAAPDMLSGCGVDDYSCKGAIQSTFPDSPLGWTDSVTLAVRKLKGKAIDIRSAEDFAKAIQEIERLSLARQ